MFIQEATGGYHSAQLPRNRVAWPTLGGDMATIAAPLAARDRRPDLLSGTPRAGFIDRWIYVFTAASFIVMVLTGFIPDSLQNLAMIKAHQRPPYPLIADVHAVVMGSFLLL